MTSEADLKTEPLGTLVENHDSERIPLSSRERATRVGPYPYYGATGIMGYVDEYLFDGLYLLVAEDGSVEDEHGRPIVQLVNGQFWSNNHAHVLRAPRDHDTKFLYYALQTVGVRPYLNGSVQLKLNQRSLNAMAVPYPECPRKRAAIAEALGALDDKIELNGRMNETLKEMARAVYDARFPRPWRSPGPPTSGPSSSPPDGSLAALGDLVELTVGGVWGESAKTPKKDTQVRVLRGIDLHNFNEGGAPRPPSRWLSNSQIRKRRLEVGDILVEASGSNCGRNLWVDRDVHELIQGEPTYSNFVKRLRPTVSVAQSSVIGQQLRLAFEDGAVQEFRTGTSIPNLDIHGLLERLSVVCPEEAEAREFLEWTRFHRHPARRLESDVLRELRDTLLPKLVSGEVRVPDAERLVSEVT